MKNKKILKKDRINNKKEIIEVHQQDFKISKKNIAVGEVKVHKTVNSEIVSTKIPLLHDEVRIEHKKINKEITSIPKVRTNGNTTIIPVIKEIAVVIKKMVLVKEIHITKERFKNVEEIKTELRKEEVKIEKENFNTSK